MKKFELTDGTTVTVNVQEALGGGYSVEQNDGVTAGTIVTCNCPGKGSVTKTCPTSAYTCDCRGSSPSLTCN